jgi:fatty acid desaturase
MPVDCMDAPVATKHTLDQESVRALSAPSNLHGVMDVVLVWGLIVSAIVMANAVNRWYVYLIASVVIGSRQNALATLAHEAWHCLTFSSRKVNHWVGAWLYSYPIGIPYYHDRERHLRHHREVGYDYDPDWVNYSNQNRESPWRVLRYLASLLFGALLFSTLFSLVTRGRPRISLSSGRSPADTPGMLGELGRSALCQGVLFLVATFVFHWWTYFLLWLLPLATFAGFFANFRSFVEHVAASDDAMPEERLRDIEASPLTRFFLSPSHFNFHALHHAHPSIPHYNLPKGKSLYIKQAGVYPFTVWPGYTIALLSHLRRLQTRSSTLTSTGK